jgi:hypothetical protein
MWFKKKPEDKWVEIKRFLETENKKECKRDD